ncbi:hypothetical protein KIN20_018634 [Parelaphostrongylus tenuis]|uniref:Uncharacterized protein n=1 Tax=Parelaphostrongylus tenuis TaxID=148309 RepID=A0AAD5N3Y1_PARTN|nr:hypothetical protein KIN20_018634 [Parelaphostrongylus tenuis]
MSLRLICRLARRAVTICDVHTAQRCFETIVEGDRLTDESREGPLREIDRQAVVDRSEEDPSMSCQMLADEIEVSQDSSPRNFYAVGYVG